MTLLKETGAVHQLGHSLHTGRHVAMVLARVHIESTGVASTSTFALTQAVYFHPEPHPLCQVELNRVVTSTVRP